MGVAIYARVSSEDQAERGTIENQLEFAGKYCDLHQLRIIEWYKDDGISGTVSLEEREEGKRLIEDAKQGKFETLLIYKLDRLGRSARVILNAVYELEQYNVKVRSMTEPFDTGDPSGRFLLTILAGVADLERETILDRLWHGANRAARKGKWLGGIVPYGYYKTDDSYLEINERPIPGKEDMSEADVVRLIFHLITFEKFSTVKAADYLNALGIPTNYAINNRKMTRGKRKIKTAGVWRPNAVGRIITNSTYKGIHLYGKRSKKEREVIEREVPAIVSEEIWNTAQEVLKENQIEALRNTKNTQYLLRGIIRCGHCGRTYIGISYVRKDRKSLKYYLCHGKQKYAGPNEKKCTAKNLNAAWIENLVWDDCVNFIKNPGNIINELQKGFEDRRSRKKELEQEIALLTTSIQEKDFEKQSILDLYRKQIITSADVEAQLNKIGYEREQLSERKSELKNKLLAEESIINKTYSVEPLLNELRDTIKGELPFEVKREIVKALVKRITVDTVEDENGKERYFVTIEFSFELPKPNVKDSDHTVKG